MSKSDDVSDENNLASLVQGHASCTLSAMPSWVIVKTAILLAVTIFLVIESKKKAIVSFIEC
jgi:hypothetical protein